MKKTIAVLAAGAAVVSAFYLARPASAQAVCATLYEHVSFGGASMTVKPGESSAFIGTLWNDKVSSMSVTPGCGLNVWQHASYGGTHKSVVGSVPWIGDGWNDIVSSYTCSCP